MYCCNIKVEILKIFFRLIKWDGEQYYFFVCLKNYRIINKGCVFFKFRLPYFETSAATGQNVTKAVECLLDQVMLRMESFVESAQHSTKGGQKDGVDLNDAESESKCGC